MADVKGAPTSETGHSSGMGWTSGTPFDPSEYTPELAWPQSVIVYDRMRRSEAQIKSVYNATTLPIRRARWSIDPNGADEGFARQVADRLGLPLTTDTADGLTRKRTKTSFYAHLPQALLYLLYGHMPFEFSGEIGPDGLWWPNHIGPRMPPTLSKINVERNGDLRSIEQFPSGLPGEIGGPVLEIKADHLIFYSHDREGAMWQGNSILRSAYRPWMIKDRLVRVDAFKHEKNGMGIPTIEQAAGATPAQIQDGNVIASKIRAGEATGGSLPAGARLRLVGVEGQLPDTLASIRYHDEQMAQETLAMFMTLGQTAHGSRALGASFVDFFLLVIQAVAEEVACTFSDSLLERWTDWDVGPEAPVPQLVVSDIGADHSVTAEALAALSTAGAIRNDNTLDAWVRDNYRIPKGDGGPVAPPVTNNGYPAIPPVQSQPALARRRPFRY